MLDDRPASPTSGACVRVACSTSNLGPGFDMLGLALSLQLSVRARPAAGAAHEFARTGGEARAWPRGGDDLLVRAFERAWRELGGGARRFAFEVDSQIPVGRGLGSSGAAIAAGLLLAAALAPRATTREQLLGWGLELEGHPDNVTAALLGGCTIGVPRGSGPPVVVRVRVHPALGFALAWPAARLETRFARSLLPKSVPLADAVENARSLALLIAGLESGDPELLYLGGRDRLHVPFRLPHIEGGAAALEAARAAGAWLATISGSGSALFAIQARERSEAVARAMAEPLGPDASWRVVELEGAAPQPELS